MKDITMTKIDSDSTIDDENGKLTLQFILHSSPLAHLCTCLCASVLSLILNVWLEDSASVLYISALVINLAYLGLYFFTIFILSIPLLILGVTF